MSLPRELRDLVYDHVITDLPKIINVTSDRLLRENLDLSSTTVVAGHTVHPLVTFLPNIAYTHNRHYTRHPLPRNFFDTLPAGSGWDKISNLTILDMASIGRSPGRAREVIDMIRQARNLEVLVLNFKLQDFWCPPDWPENEVPKIGEDARSMQSNPPRTVDAAYIMREYQFEYLFGMDCIKRLIFRVEHGLFEHTPRSIGVLDDLKNDLMGGLKNGAGNVKEVTCEEVDVRRPGVSVYIISVERS